MLNSLRALGSSLAAKILLGFLVLTFALWGIGDMLHNSGRSHTVATVGNAAIGSDEFAHALQRETDNIRGMLGENYSPELLASLHLPQVVLQKLINHTLIRLESESLGLVPSDADVVRRIRANPAFQDSKGNFDKSIFESMLARGGISEKNYVEQLREDMAGNLLIDTLMADVPVSETAVRTLYEAREEQRNVTLYALTTALVSNVPMPDEAKIKAYYDAHARDFTAPEYRTVSYVTLSSEDVHADVPVSESELQAAYRERIEEFKRPERRTVEQLLYATQDKANHAAELLKKGESVDQVARETEVLNKNSLSLGKVERNNILESAADEVFSLHIGESTQPVQSPFGWHVFHVSAIDEPSIASFEEVKSTLEKELKQRDADDALNKMSNKLEDTLAAGGTLQEAAKELGLTVRTLGPLDKQGKGLDGAPVKELGAKGMPETEKFLQTAFKTEEKSESSLMTSKGGLYYIVRVDSITPERLRSLDEVRGQAVAGWQKEEREKRLQALAKDIAAKFATGASRDSVIAQYRLQPAVSAAIKRNSHTAGNLSLPPELVADLFAHKPQEGTDVYPGKNDEYLIGVVGSVIPAPTPDNDPKLDAAINDVRKSLQNRVQNELLDEYTQSLTKTYPVKRDEAALAAVTK